MRTNPECVMPETRPTSGNSELAGVKVPAAPDSRGRDFTDSTPLLNDPDALRARASADGYLFFRKLLPVPDLLEVRTQMLEIVQRHGWRPQGASPTDDRIDVEAINRVPEDQLRKDIGVSHEAYAQVQCLESLHRLPHHPRLLAVFSSLFATPVLVHPRHIARMITPHKAMIPTPAHQDFPLIQGSSNTWTCWFPLGDCPRELGGLTVLRASHRAGQLPVTPSSGAGGIAVQLCPDEIDWVSGNFKTGDVLAFVSQTVHKALPCTLGNRIRLSLDVRYQPADEPIETNSLLPHCPLTWEQIYANWIRDDLKYYWQQRQLHLSPWDNTLPQYNRRIC